MHLIDIQASETATVNPNLSSIELAKPLFDCQQLVHDEREASGHEASARWAFSLRCSLS